MNWSICMDGSVIVTEKGDFLQIKLDQFLSLVTSVNTVGEGGGCIFVLKFIRARGAFIYLYVSGNVCKTPQPTCVYKRGGLKIKEIQVPPAGATITLFRLWFYFRSFPAWFSTEAEHKNVPGMNRGIPFLHVEPISLNEIELGKYRL